MPAEDRAAGAASSVEDLWSLRQVSGECGFEHQPVEPLGRSRIAALACKKPVRRSIRRAAAAPHPARHIKEAQQIVVIRGDAARSDVWSFWAHALA